MLTYEQIEALETSGRTHIKYLLSPSMNLSREEWRYWVESLTAELANALLALESVPSSDNLFVAAGRLEAVDIFTDMNTSSELVSGLRRFATAIQEYETSKNLSEAQQ